MRDDRQSVSTLLEGVAKNVLGGCREVTDAVLSMLLVDAALSMFLYGAVLQVLQHDLLMILEQKDFNDLVLHVSCTPGEGGGAEFSA